MKKILSILLCLFYLLFIPSSSFARRPNIIGTLNTVNNNIIVNISMTNITELEATIKSGIEKEIIYTIELIRVWRFWPDEFISSKKIRKKIKYDSLRERYRTSSFDGVNQIEKQFNNYESVRNWIFTVNRVNLANVRELEASYYYIRVVVETKSLENVPMIGFFIHLVPEVDMTLAKESQHFFIGDNQ